MMSQHVIEIITFRLSKGCSEADFLLTCEAATSFLQTRKGFVSRRLSRANDDRYMDHVTWTSQVDAEQAMEAAMKDASLSAFIAAIDPTTMKLDHQPVLVAVN
jgi:hypothetical protein